ncbi:putative glycoside hydrolase [Shewanella aestuarii]|uniref:putative glycoside hydrolase n=1 Tax=Shewanella aestuarii TaxID=1028752 RepID=UPI001ABF29AE|nr:hypothetical protein [Shewanella aestuarii]
MAEGLVFNSYNPEGQISYQLESVAERGQVLTIDITGTIGNLYFEYPPKADLSHWGANGQLIFDLLVESTDDATELLVKIDSGWPNVSDISVDLPITGQWQQVTISIAELIAQGNRFAPGSFANLASVQNPFVIEPLGKMKLQLDNVRFEYKVSAQTEVLVYDDALAAPFSLGHYAASGELLINQIDVGGEHNKVTEFVFNTNEAVGYFQSTGITHDISGFSQLSFDVNVAQDPRANRNLMIKMDCVHPCSTGDYPLEVPDIGVWTHYQIPLTRLTTHPGSSLDLTQVESPLVIFPSWGDQQGVIIQVDNVKIH